MFSPKLLPVVSGNILVFPYKSSILIFNFLGIAKSPKHAIKISCIVIIGTVFPFATYVRSTFPNINQQLPQFFQIYLIFLQLIQKLRMLQSSLALFLIIPNTTPIVIPPVAPTNIPFFQANINTIKILKNIFFMLKPNILKSPTAHTAIARSKLVPITSSIVKAFFYF